MGYVGGRVAMVEKKNRFANYFLHSTVVTDKLWNTSLFLDEIKEKRILILPTVIYPDSDS